MILQNQDGEEITNFYSLSLGELLEVIDQAENILDTLDKRTSRYRVAALNLNSLFKIYNEKKGENVYKLIKIK